MHAATASYANASGKNINKYELNLKKLTEQGIGINNNRLMVQPNFVKIELGNCSFQMSQSLFEKFARWYLEDQPSEPKGENK